MNPRELAQFGEEKALKYLQKKGYHLVDQNYRNHRYGELDLIVLDPSKKILVVVEVKTRYINSRVSPKEAVTDRKIFQLKKTTLYYKKQKGDKVPDSLRIDAIAILVTPRDKIQSIEHIKNITLD